MKQLQHFITAYEEHIICVNGLLLTLAFMFLASCSLTDDDLSDCPKEQAGKATLSLDVIPAGWGSDATTRAYYSLLYENSGNKTFSLLIRTGDAIGLFACDKTGKVVAANLRYTYDGSAWNTDDPIEYVTDLAGYTFFAYYPWVDTLTGAPAVNATPDITSADSFFASAISSWTPAADQSDVTKFTAQDLMVGKGTNSTTYFHEVEVSFTMAHKMGLLVTKSSLDYYDMDDPTDTWSVTQTFSPNIPYALDGVCYFFAKPNTSTTLGSKTTTVASGQVEQLYFTNGEPSHR